MFGVFLVVTIINRIIDQIGIVKEDRRLVRTCKIQDDVSKSIRILRKQQNTFDIDDLMIKYRNCRCNVIKQVILSIA